MAALQRPIPMAEIWRLVGRTLGPESHFYWLAVIYSIGVGILTLAVPISVQTLINTVANIGLATPLIVLSITLFGLLMIAGLLTALRLHLMEIFGRRFYARLMAQMTLRTLHAKNPLFPDSRRSSLFNRYFDIIIVQKNIPYLVISGFTVLLQAAVGFTVTSFYHPLFLGFNIVCILLIAATWLVWGRSAVRSAIDLSLAKHDAAAHLESLAASNGYFKSDRHIAHAIEASDAVTGEYVTQHRRHFRSHFAQTLAFLFIYAAASALLLGLGGWLVIHGQLTLGQLVAAELILSAVFVGVSQLGSYLTSFYDLCAAVEELSMFETIEQDPPRNDGHATPQRTDITFAKVQGQARGRRATLDFTLPAGAKVMAAASDPAVKQVMTNILRRQVDPETGYVAFGGADIEAINALCLREQILILDRPMIIETTIREYLRLADADANSDRSITALKAVGLDEVVADLPDGLDTQLSNTGWPLSLAETLQLKLAGALLARPRVLVLSYMFDVLPARVLKPVFDLIQKDEDTTLIYFSNSGDPLGFELFLYVTADQQIFSTSFDAFKRMRDAAQIFADADNIQIAPKDRVKLLPSAAANAS